MSIPVERSVAIVVPFFDEEERFDLAGLAAMCAGSRMRLVAVDDGSRDRTPALLAALAQHDGVEVLTLPRNVGKGEAVRAGLLHALARGCEVVAFADADLATPAPEVHRLIAALDPGLEVVLGSRVLMAGRTVERRASRHYAGRVFATLAATILRTPFYDTQCGAKVFRVTDALRASLGAPFLSRWAFDVELIGRLLIGGAGVDAVPLARFREVPLETWIDRGTSKVTTAAKIRTLAELIAVERELRRLRAAAGAQKSSRTRP